MLPQIETHAKQLTQQLIQIEKSSEQLQTVVERVVQVLNKRGIQIQINFTEMFEENSQEIEKAHKAAQFLDRQLVQMQELVHTSALLTSSLEFERVLEEVIDVVIRLTGAERAYLMLQRGGNEEEDLYVHIARNALRESLSADDITFSRGIIKTAIEQARPLVATNALTDERFAEMKSVFVNELRSIIIIPLILKEKVVGVLYADNRIEQGVFSEESVPLLSAFANQAAIAISNARLFEQVRDDLKAAQSQVQRLLVEIDRQQVEDKVSEITESDFFKDLKNRAESLRRRTQTVTEQIEKLEQLDQETPDTGASSGETKD
jgi:transcriptional regulator with GAF, ATPase, and Fis domain